MVTATPVEAPAPQRLKMSYEDYLRLANDSSIMEWVDGEVITYMPPVHEHQRLVLFLCELLNGFIQYFTLGTLIPAPFEVKLWSDGPSREPDIIFISQKNQHKLTEKRFEGAPDLIIEIISPSSVTEDRVYKFTNYMQAGVAEYWIIDPRPRQHHADFYVLGEGQVYHPAPIDDDGLYHSTAIPNFWFNLDWLWQEELPNPQLALAEIMISVETLPSEAKETYERLYGLLAGK